MPPQDQIIDVQRILRDAGPYPLAAYDFVREGLAYTVERIHEDAAQMQAESRHVSGQQLCMGLREFAIEQFGLMAPSVLEHWRIHRTEDFGRIVYAMIDAGLMSRNEGDSREHFRAVYDFEEAFSRESLLDRIRRD